MHVEWIMEIREANLTLDRIMNIREDNDVREDNECCGG